MTTHENSSHQPSVGLYVGIFVALLILLAVTVKASFIHLGLFNPIVAMSIAVIKATLVVLYFMHLRYSNRVMAVFILAAMFWLGILFTLTFSDYLSRSWLPSSRGWYNNRGSPVQPLQP